MREVVTADACHRWVNSDERQAPAAFKGLDLRDLRGFESGTFEDCLFLGCQMTPAQAGYVTITGATVISNDDDYPFELQRTHLYTPEELFAGFDVDEPDGYQHTFDAKVYRHWVATGRQNPASVGEGLARRLHDFSITEALTDTLVGHQPVAVMGGHGVERSSARYRQVAMISRSLTRAGKLMLSGGGPGAMEATHLGAWFADRPDEDLDAAIGLLSPRPPAAEPGREYADPDWLSRAWTVRERWPMVTDDPTRRTGSIGIPTWAYGHEPPAAFATQIAKYFANSVREDGLLAVATSGVIFTPGSAGTIQELFQDTTQNHYSVFGPPSPMVLLGVDYWTRQHPVWPVLESLANGRPYRDLIVLTDDPEEVVKSIEAYERPAN